MRGYRLALLMPLCLLLLAAGCTNQEQVDTLSARVAEQDRQLTALRQELSTARQDVEGVRPQQADLWAQIEDVRVRQAQIDGRMQELERRQMTQEERLTSDQQDIEALNERTGANRLAMQRAAVELGLHIDELYAGTAPAPTHGGAMETETNVPAATGETDATGTTATGPDTAGTTAPGSEATDVAPNTGETAQRLYASALDQFKARNYAAARSAWQEFVQTFPKHDLVPNAVFWQGESLYQMRDYANAILAYQEVIAKYPDSSKYASALLKQGISFYKIGREKAGKLLLNDVIQKFPGSPEAKRAQRVLSQN